MYDQKQSKKIIRLNDELRTTFKGQGGRVVFTDGFRALPDEQRMELLRRIRDLRRFDPLRDVDGLHETATVRVGEQAAVFRIDYFEHHNAFAHFGSEDPADPARTERILCIMLPEEEDRYLSAECHQNGGYLVVAWPDNQYLMGSDTQMHLADARKAYRDFGDSAYFVDTAYYEARTGTPVPNLTTLFTIASRTELAALPPKWRASAYLCTDAESLRRYGRGAHFVQRELLR